MGGIVDFLTRLVALFTDAVAPGDTRRPLPTILNGTEAKVAKLGDVTLDGASFDAWLSRFRSLLDDAALRETLLVRVLQLKLPRIAGPAGVWLPSGAAMPALLPLVQPPWRGLWVYAENQWYTFPLPLLMDVLLQREGYTRGRLTTLAAAYFRSYEPVTLVPQAVYRGDPVPIDDRPAPDDAVEGWLRVLPDSLLIRLLVQSALTSNAWRIRQGGGELGDLAVRRIITPPQGDPGSADAQTQASWRLATLIDPGGMRSADGVPPFVASTDTPAVPFDMDEGLRARLERALGATLDAVTTRIDPWVSSFAWATLSSVGNPAVTARRRLGAYGWAHGTFVGTPGPTPSGLLHTPSPAKTTVATILRDKYRTAAESGELNERGTEPWDMRLTSAHVRLANAFADDLRLGGDLTEIVGAEVERLIGEGPDAYARVRGLRAAFPVHADRPTPFRVCDGLAALAALVPDDGTAPDPLFPLRAGESERLLQLRDALDALADLLAADGLVHAVDRSLGRAAGAMDAAAGEAIMPELAFPRTDPSGFATETTVLSVLPAAAAAPGAQGGALASPEVAAALVARFGDDWAFVATLEDGSTRTVGLDELGLEPVHALTWSTRQLDELVAVGGPPLAVREEEIRVWAVRDPSGASATVSSVDLPLPPSRLADKSERQVRTAVIAAAGLSPASAVEVQAPPEDARLWTPWSSVGEPVAMVPASLMTADASDPADLHRLVRIAAGRPEVIGVVPPPQLGGARAFCDALGSPASERDLAVPGSPAPATDAAYATLVARYRAVFAALAAARTAAGSAAALGVGGAGAQRAAIRVAAQWGVTPDSDPADAATFRAAMCGQPVPPGATSLRDLTRTVRSVLAERLAAAPSPGSLRSPAKMATPQKEDAVDRRATGIPDGVPSLARALSTLAAPQGNLPILIEWSLARLNEATGIAPQPRPGLDEAWLSIAAAVRPPLARIEAVQLDALRGGAAPLTMWASGPDPWLVDEISAVQVARATEPIEQTPTPRFRAAFGPPTAFDGTSVAVGVVDAYTEMVPVPQRTTNAAFGFNAPAARAPQAILVAVPPSEGVRLEDDLLHEILAETRELLVARTATGEDLAELGDLLPRGACQHPSP